MARPGKTLVWTCPECGCGATASFGTVPFEEDGLCPACGCPFGPEEIADSFARARAKACEGAAADWFRSPFPPVLLPPEAAGKFDGFLPDAAAHAAWSDFSFFDVRWLSRRKAAPVEALPLETVSPEDWEILSDGCRHPVVAFADAVRRGDADAVAGTLGDANGADLPRFERVLSAHGWPVWRSRDARRIARAVSNAVARLERPDLVDSFSRSTKLRLVCLRRGKFFSVPDTLLEDLAPADVLFVLREGRVEPDRIAIPPPEEWNDADAVDLLAMTNAGKPDGFAETLAARWNDGGWPEERIAEALRDDPAAVAEFPGLPSSVVAKLLEEVPDAAAGIAKAGLVPRLRVGDFLRLCGNARTARVLVEAFPLERLGFAEQEELLRVYPPAESSVPWREWPVHRVAALFEDRPELEASYPRRKALAAYRFFRLSCRAARFALRSAWTILRAAAKLAARAVEKTVHWFRCGTGRRLVLWLLENWKGVAVALVVIWIIRSC